MKKRIVKLFLSFVMSISAFLILAPLSFADAGGAINQESNITFYEETETTKDSLPINKHKVDSDSNPVDSKSTVNKPLPQTGEDNSKFFVIAGCIFLFILVCSLEMKWRKKDV